MDEHKRSLNKIDDIKRLLTNYIFGQTQFTDLLTDKMQAIASQSIHQQINNKKVVYSIFLKNKHMCMIHAVEWSKCNKTTEFLPFESQQWIFHLSYE